MQMTSQDFCLQETNIHNISHLLDILDNRRKNWIHSIHVFHFALIPKVMNDFLSSSC